MNILEGIKATNPKPSQTNQTQTKFIIKSKPSLQPNRQNQSQTEQPIATKQDVHQFITYMVTKSKRYHELLESKGIEDQNQFADKHLYENPCMRTLLKTILDKMLRQRRIGKNLKGIGKGLLQQIQTQIWNSLDRQTALYQVNVLYEKEKDTLTKQIAERKKNIEKQIQELTSQLQNQVIEPQFNILSVNDQNGQ